MPPWAQVLSYSAHQQSWIWGIKRSGYYRNLGSLRAGTRHHREFLRYGNSFPPTFPEDLLAHASPNDWPIVTKHANTSSRGSINAAPMTITSESDTERRVAERAAITAITVMSRSRSQGTEVMIVTGAFYSSDSTLLMGAITQLNSTDGLPLRKCHTHLNAAEEQPWGLPSNERTLTVSCNSLSHNLGSAKWRKRFWRNCRGRRIYTASRARICMLRDNWPVIWTGVSQ